MTAKLQRVLSFNESTLKQPHVHSIAYKKSLNSHTENAILRLEKDGDKLVAKLDGKVKYAITTEKGFFSTTVTLKNLETEEILYVAKPRSTLGYIWITSERFRSKFQFAYPSSESGIFGFLLDGTLFFWDFQESKYLRCFTASKKKLVAQFTLGYSDGDVKGCPVGCLVLRNEVTGVAIQPFLLLTAALLPHRIHYGMENLGALGAFLVIPVRAPVKIDPRNRSSGSSLRARWAKLCDI
ncbi:hypothetical protein K493DRAFT_346830 [Basidiobolus meristosporus CBS 931.73]|uniref:Uncharacterized protein n=1 Tax=Basidiobolus meristosporus CBS 931.73 TaxID=1314790 RepID=A0A1Y1YW93_9FUNG|nr:hypothetical protein K493DRAFT_346830 [Basidiobolus meristosporus CBS 931.73]|eukprot:ORY02229.1 hypothetical protein K493DRAFT_346830 [Basidiobolus meristosporus CBS 931.73]